MPTSWAAAPPIDGGFGPLVADLYATSTFANRLTGQEWFEEFDIGQDVSGQDYLTIGQVVSSISFDPTVDRESVFVLYSGAVPGTTRVQLRFRALEDTGLDTDTTVAILVFRRVS